MQHRKIKSQRKPSFARTVTYGLHVTFLLIMALNLFYLISKLSRVNIGVSEHAGTRIGRDMVNAARLERDAANAAPEMPDTIEKKNHLLQFVGTKEITRVRSVPKKYLARKIITDPKWIEIKAQSEKTHIYVDVDGVKVYSINDKNERSRGLHIIVLNQYSGKLMAGVSFDFYGGATDSQIAEFLDYLQEGRIVVFLIKDDGSYGLKNIGRNAIKSYGSKMIFDVKFRDHWACISKKQSGWAVENISKLQGYDKWPNATQVRATILLDSQREYCDFGETAAATRKKTFCEDHEGYAKICKCNEVEELYKAAKPLNNNRLQEIPVVVIASSRPRYLFRMLRKLLSVPGADPALVTIYIDGFHNETAAVARLFGLRTVRNDIECMENCRIQQHYRKSLTNAFDTFPNAKAVMIVEEDLEVSVDIFNYFSQMLPLLETDPSLYCVSAWNDQGYKHSVGDPALLYRVETMPGLGWLLKRSLYKDELEPQWPGPDKHWDWDIWMRQDGIRKGRECIIPDVSRTYHFGAIGLNVGMYFQQLYFKERALNHIPEVKFDVEKVRKDNYEKELQKIISKAEVVNYTKTYCETQDDFIANTTGKIYAIFIKMEKENRYKTWLQVAKCFKLWDLDVRDFHDGLVRFWIKGNHVVVIGTPESKYAHYKPKSIKPVQILPRKILKKGR